jgi:hypothetical protein
MRDIQTVTIYYQAAYAIAAVILSGYAVGLVVAARRARARLERANRAP